MNREYVDPIEEEMAALDEAEPGWDEMGAVDETERERWFPVPNRAYWRAKGWRGARRYAYRHRSSKTGPWYGNCQRRLDEDGNPITGVYETNSAGQPKMDRFAVAHMERAYGRQAPKYALREARKDGIVPPRGEPLNLGQMVETYLRQGGGVRLTARQLKRLRKKGHKLYGDD